jgi:hypothetical protein
VTGTRAAAGRISFVLAPVRGNRRARARRCPGFGTLFPFRHRTRLLEASSVRSADRPTDRPTTPHQSFARFRTFLNPRSSASSKDPLRDLLSPYETYSPPRSNPHRCVLGAGTPPFAGGSRIFRIGGARDCPSILVSPRVRGWQVWSTWFGGRGGMWKTKKDTFRILLGYCTDLLSVEVGHGKHTVRCQQHPQDRSMHK